MAKLNLGNREQKAVALGAVVAVLIVGWIAARGPLDTYRKSKIRVQTAEQNLEMARILHGEIINARKNEELIRKQLTQRGNLDLSSFLSGIVREKGLYERNAEVKAFQRGLKSDKLVAVQVELKGVSAAELLDVLHRIYSSENLVVLHKLDWIKLSLNKQGLDCNMVLFSPKG